MKILITGADSIVGEEVAVRLLRLDDVKVCVSSTAGHTLTKLEAAGATVVRLDMADDDSMRTALDDVQRLVWVTPDNIYASAYTERMVRIATDLGHLEHIVSYAPLDADINAPRDISRQHGRTAHLIQHSGIAYTLLRINLLAQNLSGRLPWVFDRGQHTVYLPIGDGAVAWVDAHDVAAMVVYALNNIGARHCQYTISGPAALTVHEAVDIIKTETGVALEVADVEKWDYLERMRDCGSTEYAVDSMTVLIDEIVRGAFAAVSDDYQQAIGSPATDFTAFVRANSNVWTQH